MTRALLAAAIVLVASSPAHAQEPRWDVELYGGAVAGAPASAGTLSLPAAGAPLVTSNPTFPSRETRSWWFGDGAALLNSVLQDFAAASRLTPLDPLFAGPRTQHTAHAGVRLLRRMSPRWSMEVDLGTSLGSTGIVDGLGAAVEETRRSFAPAFNGLFGTGPFTAISIDATAQSVEGSRRDTTATVALNAHLPAWRSLSPYLTFGGGVAVSSGTLPSATLRSSYHFAILGEVPIVESDQVALRWKQSTTPGIVLGGGVRKNLSAKWGLSVDGRVFVAPDRTSIVLTAHPASVRGTPAGFVESFTSPSIQFSNDAATGRRSTLSAAPLDDVEVFSGGVRSRILLTVGISRRF